MTEYRRGSKKKHKRKKKRKLLFFFVLLPILLIASTALGYSGYLTWKLAKATENAKQNLDRGDKSQLRLKAVDPSKDNISILFMGVDDRGKGEPVRSDALILATFNKSDHSIKMVSIPRDSKVKIVGKGKYDKITHAHAYGGPDMAVKTVENLFDIPIDYYVKLNFKAFMKMVDTLGGVTVDVPFTFTAQDSHDNADAITLHKGRQTLNGEEALAFTRMRKKDPEGDLGRGKRQAMIVEAIINKAASLKSITKYDNLIDDVGDNYSSNLTFGNIIALQSYAKSLKTIDQYQLQGEDSMEDGTYYFKLDQDSVDSISSILQKHLEYTPPGNSQSKTTTTTSGDKYRINDSESTSHTADTKTSNN